MKKGIITCLACLALVFSVAGCNESDDDEDDYYDDGVRTINEVLDYNNATGHYALEGETVTIKSAVVNGQHGNVLTIALLSTVTTVEVVQREINPDVTVRKIVDVTGVVENYNGHARIADAEVTVVSNVRQSVYVTTGMTNYAQFSTYGRTSSGMLAMDVPLQIVSYNGATEFAAGTDTVITTCYQGQDTTDFSKLIKFVVWGDTDQTTLDYLNAYFFGNDTGSVVTWDDPFKYEGSHCEIPADWEGVEEETGIIKGLFHFYYDEELDPDFKTMFYIDNICLPSLDSYVLYNEESAMTSVFDDLAKAYQEDSEGAAYSIHILYHTLEGQEIKSDEVTNWVTDGDNLSPEFEEYLAEGVTESDTNCWVRACHSRFEILWRNAQLTSGYYEYLNQVWIDYVDDDGTQQVDVYNFYSESAYNAFIESIADSGYQGEYSASNDEDEYNTEKNTTLEGSWYYYYITLFDFEDYDTSFHTNGSLTREIDGEELTGTQFLVNDTNVVAALWDATAGNGWSDWDYWEAEYGSVPNLEDIFLVENSSFFRIVFNRTSGWYYDMSAHPNGDIVSWSEFTWNCDVTIGDNTIGNSVES